MQIANTKAAIAYQSLATRIDWAVASDAEQLVALDDMITSLASFKGTDAVLAYGIDPRTGKRAFDSVNDVLNRLDQRQRNRQSSLLHSVGGKVASMRREICSARMRMEVQPVAQAA